MNKNKEKLDDYAYVRMTKTQRKAITEIAVKDNRDMSEYIRLLVIKEIERVNASIII